MQETKLCWDNNNCKAIQQIFQKSHAAAKLSISSSNKPSTKEYQPGGTLTSFLGPWTSRVLQAGSNSTGLGRWSYVTLRMREPQALTILSGYRVCNQNPTLGSCTCYNQQLQLLTAAGHPNPDPRK